MREAAGPPSPEGEVTQLLQHWAAGDSAALDELTPLVYAQLHRMARRHMAAQRPGHTLQATALIHEAFLKLVDRPDPQFADRAHFFAVAARAMRHILVDHARARQAAKRGGGALVKELDENDAPGLSARRAEELLALDAALQDLARLDPRKSRVVELRHFGGLSVEETATVLAVSPVTVTRDWSFARAWLHRALGEAGEPGAP